MLFFVNIVSSFQFKRILCGIQIHSILLILFEEEFIEISATYTDDGRFVGSVTDSNFNKTLYETDNVTGLLKGTTIVTNYMYNDRW